MMSVCTKYLNPSDTYFHLGPHLQPPALNNGKKSRAISRLRPIKINDSNHLSFRNGGTAPNINYYENHEIMFYLIDEN